MTARAMLREFLREKIAGADTIDTSKLVAECRKRFQRDQAFLEALADESLGVFAARALELVVKENRDERHTRMADQRAKELAARIFESVGGTTRKSLLSMKRPDLRAAAALRTRQIQGSARWVKFEKYLADNMPDDSVTVDECFNDSVFDRIWRAHFDVPAVLLPEPLVA